MELLFYPIVDGLIVIPCKSNIYRGYLTHLHDLYKSEYNQLSTYFYISEAAAALVNLLEMYSAVIVVSTGII